MAMTRRLPGANRRPLIRPARTAEDPGLLAAADPTAAGDGLVAHRRRTGSDGTKECSTFSSPEGVSENTTPKPFAPPLDAVP